MVRCHSNPNLDERTIFSCHIADASDRQAVEHALSRLQLQLLIFLRQLRSISVCIKHADGQMKQRFRLSRDHSMHDGLNTTLLTRDDDLAPARSCREMYVVCRSVAQDMPRERKRANVTESEIRIAFPVTDNFQPRVLHCLTFNFLPIRSYNLPVSRCK